MQPLMHKQFLQDFLVNSTENKIASEETPSFSRFPETSCLFTFFHFSSVLHLGMENLLIFLIWFFHRPEGRARSQHRGTSLSKGPFPELLRAVGLPPFNPSMLKENKGIPELLRVGCFQSGLILKSVIKR